MIQALLRAPPRTTHASGAVPAARLLHMCASTLKFARALPRQGGRLLRAQHVPAPTPTGLGMPPPPPPRRRDPAAEGVRGDPSRVLEGKGTYSPPRRALLGRRFGTPGAALRGRTPASDGPQEREGLTRRCNRARGSRFPGWGPSRGQLPHVETGHGSGGAPAARAAKTVPLCGSWIPCCRADCPPPPTAGASARSRARAWPTLPGEYLKACGWPPRPPDRGGLAGQTTRSATSGSARAHVTCASRGRLGATATEVAVEQGIATGQMAG
eukprot:scaffold154_cov373-Prasinococcus_capsulatus_cf.AAC.18